MSILQSGDKIGIIAPSGGLGDKDLTPFINLLKSWGIDTALADNLRSSYRYMAGSNSERAQELNRMINDSSIKALFCLRGGAGATHILSAVDYAALQNSPKPIIGLSDSTALQNAVFSLSASPSLTGFLPLYDTHDGQVDSYMAAELKHALFDNHRRLSAGKALIKGSAKGKIVGGCLSVFMQLCGTPYFPDLRDKILLIEDVGEKTYKIDLMLRQLKSQPNFSAVKGIIFGAFTDCPIKDFNDGSIDDCLADFISDLSIPVIADFPYGHIPQRYILPLGVEVNLQAVATECSLEF